MEMIEPWGGLEWGGGGAAKPFPNPQLWAPLRATEVPLQERPSFGESGHSLYRKEQRAPACALVAGSSCPMHTSSISYPMEDRLWRATQHMQR